MGWATDDLEGWLHLLTPDQIKACEEVLEVSGSGIDGDWEVSDPQKNGTIALSNDWHYMSEHGYYDGWIPFTVKVNPSGDIASITLAGADSAARYRANRIDLVDYLWQTLD